MLHAKQKADIDSYNSPQGRQQCLQPHSSLLDINMQAQQLQLPQLPAAAMEATSVEVSESTAPVRDSGSTEKLAQQVVTPVLSSHLPPAAIEPMPAEVSVSTVS